MSAQSLGRSYLLRSCLLGFLTHPITWEADQWLCAAVEPFSVAPAHLGEYLVAFPVAELLVRRTAGSQVFVVGKTMLDGRLALFPAFTYAVGVEAFELLPSPAADDITVTVAIVEGGAEVGRLFTEVFEATGGEHDAERAWIAASWHARPFWFCGVGMHVTHGHKPGGCADHVTNELLPVIDGLQLRPQTVHAQSGIAASGDEVGVVETIPVSSGETAVHAVEDFAWIKQIRVFELRQIHS